MGNRKPVLVDTSAGLKAAAAALAGAERYYLDTEFERFKLCLVQVSRGEEAYLIDAVKLTALEPLGEAIGRAGTEWVFCDGGQDAAWICEAARIKERPRVFDVQVGWGLLGPEYPAGLAYLQYRILGVRSSKEHQAGDWLARPLSEGQREYAAKDVEYLPPIREWISGKLAEKGRPDLIGEVSAETVFPPPPEPLSLDDFRNAWQLDAAGQAALLFLIDWHNGLTPAEKKDTPAPRVFLAIANLLPESGEELGRVKGVWFEWARRHGDTFTGKLIRASSGARGGGFKLLDPPPYDSFERIVAEGWIRKAAAEVSAEVGMAPELAFPGRLLKAMAKAVLEKGRKEAAAEPLAGWREKFLRGPFLSKIAP
jgi:ribonuclease D